DISPRNPGPQCLAASEDQRSDHWWLAVSAKHQPKHSSRNLLHHRAADRFESSPKLHQSAAIERLSVEVQLQSAPALLPIGPGSYVPIRQTTRRALLHALRL